MSLDETCLSNGNDVTMIYFSFNHPYTHKEKRTDTNCIKVTFKSFLLYAIKKVFPIANPDFEKAIQHVTTWYVEYDNTEYNLVLREIGKDAKNNIIIKVPDERNRGFWTDSDLDLSAYETYNITYISKKEFEKLWNSVEFDSKTKSLTRPI